MKTEIIASRETEKDKIVVKPSPGPSVPDRQEDDEREEEEEEDPHRIREPEEDRQPEIKEPPRSEKAV